MPNLILVNARIYTQWPAMPWAEAVYINHGRVLEIGDSKKILDIAPSETPILDLGGALVLPGLTDAHIHFHDIAWSYNHLALYDTESLEDAQTRIADFASGLRADEWLLGYGWRESGWPDPTFPNRHDLDPITGDRPAVLWRTDLHAAWCNSAALRAAGIGPDTPDPPSGLIDRDAKGHPTGILRELAINLVRKIIPPLDEETEMANLHAAAADLHRLGIVAIHDQRMKDHATEGSEALRLYTRLRTQGNLPLRVSCNVEAAYLDHLIDLGLQSGFGDDWVRLGHVKLFADGSLGARTAWMLAPFEGEPKNTGMYLTPTEEVLALIQRAHRHGCAISIHAIGDRANREVLDIFEEVLAAGSQHPPLIPHRIEHVQTIQPEDQPRLGAMNITASVQPIHCLDDMITANRLWGKRGRNTYVFRTLLESGANLAFGSDAPVANPDPWLGIYAAVTRQQPDGTPPGGWYPDQRLTVEQALHAYTLGAAAAIGQDHQQGRVAPGYFGDLIVIDRDIFTCAAVDIPKVRVKMTLIDGKIVYDAGLAGEAG